MKTKTKKLIVGILLLVIAVSALVIWRIDSVTSASKQVTDQTEVPNRYITVSELSTYDGSDPAKPIYLAMNGLVYDVTTGRKFYEPGGSYHWLAGKDSSTDLNLIGGDIIKKKYPVIGKLIQ